MNQQHWEQANRKLVAKTLSELHFEQLLTFQVEPSNEQNTLQGYQLDCEKYDWHFKASTSVWGMLVVKPDSIQSSHGSIPLLNDLLLDLQSTLDISDLNLAGLIEETQQTLWSEIKSLESSVGITAQDIVQMDEVSRQQYLQSHPKLIANKGRLGWGEQELAKYAPESGSSFGLHFLAVDKQISISGIKSGLSLQSLFSSFTSESEWQRLIDKLPDGGLERFDIILVHPWQLQRYLKSQFLQYFVEGKLIDLGVTEMQWLAQQSIRTLTAVDPTVNVDIKTALTILNTSCYRGIPGQYIAHGARISAWLANLVKSDALLQSHGLHVQQEIGGVYCPHPYQSKFDGAYRYNEMLGCIWRERAESILPSHQRPLSMATLMQADDQGVSCIEALIEVSGRAPQDWLKAMFKHVVVPIYHLMVKYGVGIVAHGQNVTLVLQDNFPVGCMIKDFHGDLRLIDQPFEELDSLDRDIQDNLVRLPAHYLIHDLLTGHFVTVLRFVSPWLTNVGVSETQFYRYLNQALQEYQSENPELAPRFKLLNLLTEKIDKVCLNKVRFKIGLGDSSERPLPELADPIANPLLL
ncbi:IucA/IucC family protein [Vibrio rumoiensis]|uniref:IucA/IucC family protein n=1 Tax=Vibrio rumoiensis 1S-45 TaxID=1188252 RepID=A0A1E5DZJ4_9VIBR|nr:IucA/IucC family protein [Vibrio rumoiensis]OEF23396.1 IucA/IucC family protein [Vibrio rumoiensis 1S-45]